MTEQEKPLRVRDRPKPASKQQGGAAPAPSESGMPPSPNSNATGQYAVGYRRPPKEHQFQKDQSGNSNGRPKGSKGFKAELRRLLKERIPAKIGGRPRNVSRVVALCLRLIEKAMSGDLRAISLLVQLDPTAPDPSKAEPSEVPAEIDEEAAATLELFFSTLPKAEAGGA